MLRFSSKSCGVRSGVFYLLEWSLVASRGRYVSEASKLQIEQREEEIRQSSGLGNTKGAQRVGVRNPTP